MVDRASVTLVNLRVIAKIKNGDRLQCVDTRYFGIDRGSGWLVWAWRWMRQDSRIHMLDRVDETFKEAQKMENSKYPCLAGHIKAAQGGIRELMCTYADDPTTVSRLEALIGSCPPEEDDEQAF